MSNNKKSSRTATFYSEPEVEELYTGFLIKSPPLTAPTKITKAWKRRFFVLSKTTDDSYHLTYHVNYEKKEKPLGKIDISKISLLFTSPETHQQWEWVKKQQKCSPSSVLFLKVEDDTIKHSREYFLIGENSADVEGWLNALVKAMKTQNSQNKPQHTDDTQETRSRSSSAPVPCSEKNIENQTDERWSAFELTSPPNYNHYDCPRKLSGPPQILSPVCEEKYEMDGKQDKPPEDNSEYMSMGSVQMVKDDQQEDDEACKEKNDVHRKTNQSNFTENCASAESDISASNCHQIRESRGDQTLPPGTVQEIQKYIKRLSKDEIKLLIQRLPAPTLNPAHHAEDTKLNLMRNLLSPPK